MKRIFAILLVATLTLISFSGCDEVLDALGINTDTEIDLTVQITITNADSVRVSVTNTGSNTAANVEFRLYLTTRTEVQPADHLIYTDFVDVPPTTTEPVDVPFSSFENLDTLESGNYRVGVIVDPDNSISESNDNNNKATSADTYNHTGGSASTAPSTPTGLTVTSTTSTSISLTWNAAADATGYELYRDTSSGGLFTTLVYDNTGTSMTDAGLSPSTTYYYKVRAKNSAGSSLLSTAVSGVTLSDTSGDSYEPDDNSSSATALVSGASQTHTIGAAGDADWYSFSATAGMLYYVETYSTGGTDVDLVINLYDDSVALIDSVDYEYTNSSESLDFEAGSTGTYYVEVIEYYGTNTGDYAILMNEYDPAYIDVTIQ